MILVYLIILATFIYFVFFMAQFYNIIFHGYPPFISSSHDNIKKIIELAQIKDGDVIYELGCGRARFLKSVENIYPKTKLIGVENLFSINLVNQIRLKLQNSKIKLINANFFKLNLSEADIIYCYLNNTTMLPLGKKLISECKPGTQIISQAFSVPQLRASKVVQINDKKVYFYIV